MTGRSLLAAAMLAALAGTAVAQEPERPGTAPRYRWIVAGAIGLARRQNEPWDDIHQGLGNSGWDTFFSTGICYFTCEQGAADAAQGRPIAATASVRAGLAGRWQLRAFATTVPVGFYPGSSGALSLAITPSARAVGAQVAWAWRGIWLAAGPALQFGTVTETAGTTRQVVRRSAVGADVGLGFTFPGGRRWFLETSLERSFGGALDVPALAVPGAPTVPAMRVPLSHTLLAIGAGLRFAPLH